MWIVKTVLTLVQWGVVLGLSLLAIYMISANFNVLGGYHPYVVQSGSMEPAIMTGDVIVIHTKGVYEVNDVITFRNAMDHIVTHRIVEVDRTNGNRYSTKGDANRSGDDDAITDPQILGAVALVIPKLGYLVATAKSKMGIVYMILIPALVFILDELVTIQRNSKKSKSGDYAPSRD